MEKEWYENTILSIELRGNGKFYVAALAPKQTHIITSRKSFRTYDLAHTYCEKEYGIQENGSNANGSILLVAFLADIELEIEYRREIQKKLAEQEAEEQDEIS